MQVRRCASVRAAALHLRVRAGHARACRRTRRPGAVRSARVRAGGLRAEENWTLPRRSTHSALPCAARGCTGKAAHRSRRLAMFVGVDTVAENAARSVCRTTKCCVLGGDSACLLVLGRAATSRFDRPTTACVSARRPFTSIWMSPSSYGSAACAGHERSSPTPPRARLADAVLRVDVLLRGTSCRHVRFGGTCARYDASPRPGTRGARVRRRTRGARYSVIASRTCASIHG